MHNNLTKKRVLHWSLLLEEHVPTIKYIKGTNNDTDDDLEIIKLINYDVTERDITRKKLDKNNCVDRLDGDMLSLTYGKIHQYQGKDKELVDKLKRTKYVCGGGKVTQIICRSNFFCTNKHQKVRNRLVIYVPTASLNGSY